jgi:monoamine oxidase
LLSATNRAEGRNTIILGGGVAGLAAAQSLTHAGRKILLLEARPRLGGRVYTWPASGPGVPIELGAEFVHGRPPELWKIIEAARLPVQQVVNLHHVRDHGRLSQVTNYQDRINRLLGEASEKTAPDRSVMEYLKAKSSAAPEDLALAKAYVEGFHAADASKMSLQGFAHAETATSAGGDSQFRLAVEYEAIVSWLREQLPQPSTEIRLGSVATEVRWARGRVEVDTRTPAGDIATVSAPQAIITLPLGVLKAPDGALGAVRFTPELRDKQPALRLLEMGAILRVMFWFDTAFWSVPELSFLHDPGGLLPIWWTRAPARAPVLTGWLGGPPAAALAREGPDRIVQRAIDSLGHALGVDPDRVRSHLREAHYHDWIEDPFSRGAYSYVAVGGLAAGAQAKLAEPLEGTLFFAGEATQTDGNLGTVHGAIASGYRAAREALAVEP